MASPESGPVPTAESSTQKLSDLLGDGCRSADFVSVVRRAECAAPDRPRQGDAIRVQDDALRLSQRVSLGFHGVSLDSLEPGTGHHAWRLYCNFFGLLGSNGPMPLHFTEYADQRARHHSDATFREFLDLFNHRLLSLFYRASTQFDPAVNGDRPHQNEYQLFLGALAGIAPDAAQHRDAIPDNFKRHFAGWLGNKTRTPDGLSTLLGEYLNLPVRIEEFVGGWLTLPQEGRCYLNRGASAQLGVSTYIGKRVWSSAHRFRIVLGPMEWQEFQSFAPNGERVQRVYELVRNTVGDEWDWTLELTVRRASVASMRLDKHSSLGFSSWLSATGTSERAASASIERSVLAAQARRGRSGLPSETT